MLKRRENKPHTINGCSLYVEWSPSTICLVVASGDGKKTKLRGDQVCHPTHFYLCLLSEKAI